jgi:hypothetical protein
MFGLLFHEGSEYANASAAITESRVSAPDAVVGYAADTPSPLSTVLRRG